MGKNKSKTYKKNFFIWRLVFEIEFGNLLKINIRVLLNYDNCNED